MTTLVESDSSGPWATRLEHMERRIRSLRRLVLILGVGLLTTMLALFVPEARLLLWVALWVAGILLVVLAFIGAVMWALARLDRTAPTE